MELHVLGEPHRFVPPNRPQCHSDSQAFPSKMQTYRQVLIFTVKITVPMSALLDKHAPLVTRQVTDRMSAPWMTQEIKQAKQQRRCAERQWHKTSLEVHRQIYAHCRNVVNRQIRNAKKRFLCEKIVSANSSKELFRLSGQMMGTSMNTVLPGNISPVNLPSNFKEFFVTTIETIRNNLDSTPRRADSVAFSGIPLETFHAVNSGHVM